MNQNNRIPMAAPIIGQQVKISTVHHPDATTSAEPSELTFKGPDGPVVHQCGGLTKVEWAAVMIASSVRPVEAMERLIPGVVDIAEELLAECKRRREESRETS